MSALRRPRIAPAILMLGLGVASEARAQDPMMVAPTAPAIAPAPPAAAAPSTAPLAPTAIAAPAPPLEVVIAGDKSNGDTASRIDVGRRELELRPRLRPGDIVEAVPGLFAVQHAGGGKSNQYLLRGFDADHGTDVAFFTDGVPVNMPSHGHGQGFADLHFIIPELVVGLEGYKGMSFAQYGDFATAGAVNMKFAEKFEESYASYSVGQFGVMRGLVVASPDLGDDWRAVAAAEVYKDDGPFINPEGLRRFNLYLRVTHDLSASSKVSLTWMSYGSSWSGSGQIPARAVCNEGDQPNFGPVNPPPQAYGQNCISHFGYIDPTEGGDTQRHMAALAYTTKWQDTELTAQTYLIKYRFSLYSNFTFFEVDPIHGDEVEQDDDRLTIGGDFRVKRQLKVGDSKFTTSIGAQIRNDNIDNGLYHDERRSRLNPYAEDHISVSNIGLFAEEDMRLTKWLRLVAGLRGDRIDVNVDDKLAGADPQGGDQSGAKGAQRASPKFQAVLSPIKQLDVFADYGRGFHTNDARGVVQHVNPATLMTAATSYETGLRIKPFDNFFVQGDAYVIDLDSELVWNGDSGGTEPAGATRRYGVELSARYHIGNVFYADADFTASHARFLQNIDHAGTFVPLAPVRTFSAGFGLRPTFGHYTPFFEGRVRSLSDRPADPLNQYTDQGWTIVSLQGGLRWKSLEASVDVQNLFNASWREVSFTQDSRLPYEPKTVIGSTYTPGWPRTVIGTARLYWQ